MRRTKKQKKVWQSTLNPSEIREEPLTLDVGCGVEPKGNINCDLSISDDGSRSGDSRLKRWPLNKKDIPNLVLCDAQYLPFKSAAFSKVETHHSIEHVDNPQVMLKELIRVSNDTIEIFCPHRYGDRFFANIYLHRSKVEFHKNFFNKAWFFSALKNYNLKKVKVDYSTYLSVPSEFLTFFRVPLELHISIKKGAA